MRTVGLLFLCPEPEATLDDQPEPRLDDRPQAALVAGGISVIERQARQLRRAGVGVLFAVDVVPLTVLPRTVTAVSAAALPGLIAAEDRVVVVAPGLIIDERAYATVLAAPVPALLVCDATREVPRGVERLDALTFASGLMVLPGALVRTIAAGLGEWDLGSTLIRAAATDPATHRVEFGDIPLYAANRRREVPLLWARPQSAAEARAAGETIVAAAQKGCLDWPARYIHPPIEDAMVRLLAPTPITPNMVTLATGVVGIAAGVAFAFGWLWWGLALALLTGPLDGVDGKLARTRVEFSKWGDLEHLLDKVLEYGWYLCVAGHFATVMGSALPWAVAALIILPALAEAVQGEFFRRITGFQLDDAGATERRIRMFAGRRNTFLWTWLPFAALGLWFDGFVMIAAYSIATTAVAQWRFYVRTAEYGRHHGQEIAANLDATGYDFLPESGASPK